MSAQKPQFNRSSGKFKAGVVYNPDRLRILELLDEPAWRCGSDSTEIGNVLGLPRVKASKHLDGLKAVGKVELVSERVTGRPGIRHRFFLPINRDLALAASETANASYKNWKQVDADKRARERAKEKRRAAAAARRAKGIEPAGVGPITPCKAKVWSMPFQPAGFADLKPGQYLAGDSWASRAFAGCAV